MERIGKLAAFSVMRGVGFACLAIVTTMSGLAFDPALSLRVGALMMLGLALFLQFRALTYGGFSRVTETEVWLLLEEGERPPKDHARRMIVAAMRQEFHEKALWAAVVAAGLFAISVILRLAF